VTYVALGFAVCSYGYATRSGGLIDCVCVPFVRQWVKVAIPRVVGEAVRGSPLPSGWVWLHLDFFNRRRALGRPLSPSSSWVAARLLVRYLSPDSDLTKRFSTRLWWYTGLYVQFHEPDRQGVDHLL
jgi:hypothetical protein